MHSYGSECLLFLGEELTLHSAALSFISCETNVMKICLTKQNWPLALRRRCLVIHSFIYPTTAYCSGCWHSKQKDSHMYGAHSLVGIG